MAYAISVWFDQESEDSIRAIWRELHERELTSFLWTGNFRPHITLAIYEKLDVDGFSISLRKFLSQIAPFKITLPSIGIFSSSPGVSTLSGNAVFLGVTPTDKFLNFHAKIHKILSDFGNSPRTYYLPDHWNPHSTVAREISAESISQIVRACQKFNLPIHPIINRIGIIDTPVEVELDCCMLGGTE